MAGDGWGWLGMAGDGWGWLGVECNDREGVGYICRCSEVKFNGQLVTPDTSLHLIAGDGATSRNLRVCVRGVCNVNADTYVGV